MKIMLALLSILTLQACTDETEIPIGSGIARFDVIDGHAARPRFVEAVSGSAVFDGNRLIDLEVEFTDTVRATLGTQADDKGVCEIILRWVEGVDERAEIVPSVCLVDTLDPSALNCAGAKIRLVLAPQM